MNQFDKNRFESAETKVEKQAEEAEKKMAAKERVEVVAREVKNTKQQMQNIMANMAAVMKAVAAIRAQLQLAQTGSIPSVEKDKKSISTLQKKLDRLFGEIGDLKLALLIEERKAVGEENADWGEKEIEAEAGRRVEEILQKLGIKQEAQ